jgi:hypothetical protein
MINRRCKLGGEEGQSFLLGSPLWSGGGAYRLSLYGLASWVVILMNILSGYDPYCMFICFS